MTIYSKWSTFFVATLLTASSFAWSDFRFSLEPSLIQPGERATLTLRLPEKDLVWPEGTKGEDLFPEANDEWLIQTENLELLNQDYRKENGEYVWRYQFTSYSEGEIKIAPISVKMGPQSFSTEQRTLQVVSTRKDAELRPNAGPLSPPVDWLFNFLLFTLAAALCGAFWWFRKRWHSKKPALPASPSVAPLEDLPREWLRKQLLVLKARMEAAPHEPFWPDVWSSVLRDFATRETRHPALAWTTSEIARHLGSDARYAELGRLFQECDLAKFSKANFLGSSEQATLRWIRESERIFL
jgi:hypothetical protein